MTEIIAFFYAIFFHKILNIAIIISIKMKASPKKIVAHKLLKRLNNLISLNSSISTIILTTLRKF